MHSTTHRILLDPSKCVGCTNCIKCCPMEAIRVKRGLSKTIKDRCIHCGQCIPICPRKARSSISDDLTVIEAFPYKIALIDPVLYGQFDEHICPEDIIHAIKALGFDAVFETSHGADCITEFTRERIHHGATLPVISSSCPTIIRLIQIYFPSLIEHILPIDSPVEVSASMARKKAIEASGRDEKEIGVFYISPCPARMFSFERPVGIKTSHISGTLSIRSLFLELSKILGKISASYQPETSEFYPSGKGIGWARTGGQSYALGIDEYLSVDGIKNVIHLLEEVEYRNINRLYFLECLACTNGCVGGSFTVENSFLARNRIRRLVEKYDQNTPLPQTFSYEDFFLTEPILPIQSIELEQNLNEAIKKMEQIKEIYASLPHIDCGACGAPNCKALAEDVVMGFAKVEDCIVILKKQMDHGHH